MRRTRWKELALCAALLLALAGCGGSGGTEDSATDSRNDETPVVSENASVGSETEDAATPETAEDDSTEADSGETADTGESSAVSTVYFTSDISPEGLIRAYEALNWTPAGRVAVKLSTG